MNCYTTILARLEKPEQRCRLYRARDAAENFAEGVWGGHSKWEDAQGWHTPFNDRGYATGFVYFARVLNYVKIGFTKQNPHARIANLQTGCPFPIRIIGFVFADRDLERDLQMELLDYRAEGEWFTLTSEKVRKTVRCILNQDAR